MRDDDVLYDVMLNTRKSEDFFRELLAFATEARHLDARTEGRDVRRYTRPPPPPDRASSRFLCLNRVVERGHAIFHLHSRYNLLVQISRYLPPSSLQYIILHELSFFHVAAKPPPANAPSNTNTAFPPLPPRTHDPPGASRTNIPQNPVATISLTNLKIIQKHFDIQNLQDDEEEGITNHHPHHQ